MQATAKKSNEPSSSDQGKKHKKPGPEEAVVQREINPLWHSMATNTESSTVTNTNVSAISAKQQSVTTKKPNTSAKDAHLVQRLCSECDQGLAIEAGSIQRKLSVGAPNDPYEQEADRASAAVRAGEKVSPVSRIASTVARAPSQGAKKTTASASLESRITSPSGGRPLAEPMRKEMESSFNTDFSAVRIYDSASAQTDASDLGAHAFTHKNGIWLGSGSSSNDQGLMAHELTHVVQQGSSIRRKVIDENQQEGTKQHENDSSQSEFYASEEPQIQAAWYNFDIPYTDYQFDPTIRGVKFAANVAKDTAVSAFQWVFDKIEGLVDAGKDWLNDQFKEIKEFAASAFTNVSSSLSILLGFITVPISLVTSAIENMDADLLSVAWQLLSAGANAVKSGMSAVIKGVLDIGNGLWKTASGYVSKLFSNINGLINSWGFRQLPGIIQRNARKLIDGVNRLWLSIKNYITDLMKEINRFVKRILDSIENFITNIVAKGIKQIIKTVRDIQESWQFVSKIAADPEGYAKPYVNKVADKLNAEAPPDATALGQDTLQENFHVESSSTGRDIIIQRQPKNTKQKRRTASFNEVLQGFGSAISEAWSNLDIGEMLWGAVVSMFWPPATFRAIGHEFSELWNKDWANTAGSLFMPRNIAKDFWGFFHDVWSNILVLLDFPLALWRRLNAILMLLLGFVTLLLLFVGAVVGGVVGASAGGAGAIPGALAGMGAALEVVAPAGLFLLGSYFAAEIVTVIKSFADLFTARQTQTEKGHDFIQIAGSLIGMAAALILIAILFLIASFISVLVSRIRGFTNKPKANASKSSEPVKTSEPAKATEPSKPPAEEVKSPSEDVKPKADKKSDPVENFPDKPNMYQVKDASALKATEPTKLPGSKGQFILHWELYVELPSGQRAVFCEVNIRSVVSRGSPDLNLHPKNATVRGVPETVNLYDLSKISWTKESLRLVTESYKAKFGHAPKNLGGWLAKSNLKNFQNTFARIRAQYPGMSHTAIGELAIRKISFGKNRIQMGYEYFHVTLLKFAKVTLKDGSTQLVPMIVRVEAGLAPFAPTMAPPLKPPSSSDIGDGGDSDDED